VRIRRVVVGAVGLVLAWASLIALWPDGTTKRTAAPASTQRDSVPMSVSDAAPLELAERVVLVLEDLGPSHRCPDLQPIASFLADEVRREMSVEACGLTPAQIAERVTESTAIEAASVAPEGADRVAVWIDAVVTVTTPGGSTQQVAAPMVVDVVRASSRWLVDGLGEP
jgi:hypothetical protein